METAKLMHGRVPEWDSTYLEKHIPQGILEKMKEVDEWEDEDNFVWGFGYTFATLYEGRPAVAVATKAYGLGNNSIKVVLADGQVITMWV